MSTVKRQTPSHRTRVDRKVIAIKLYYQGHSIQDIVDRLKAEFGLSLVAATVKVWVDEHLETLKISRPDVVSGYKFVELEKINRLEIEYWTGWTKSSSVQVTIRETFAAKDKETGDRVRLSKKKPHGELESTTKETKTLTGDSKFLQGVQWCIEQRMKILGLEAMNKIEFGNDENADAVLEGANELAQVQEGPRKIIFKVA